MKATIFLFFSFTCMVHITSSYLLDQKVLNSRLLLQIAFGEEANCNKRRGNGSLHDAIHCVNRPSIERV